MSYKCRYGGLLAWPCAQCPDEGGCYVQTKEQLSPTPLTDAMEVALFAVATTRPLNDAWAKHARSLELSLAERDAELLAVTKQLRDSCLDTRSEGEWYEWGCPIATDLRSRIAAAEARNAALVEALKKYGRHESHCNKSWHPHYHKCECGLSAALTEQRGGKHE